MSSRTILIIEDDLSQAESLGDLLDLEGFNPISATTCAAGLKLAQEASPPVILLDIKLPDGSGVDLLGEIRKVLPECSCIILSAFADLETTLQALNQGASHFLRKPVNPPELLTVLRDAFELIDLREEKRKADSKVVSQRDDLERKVGERTGKLEAANQQLVMEVEERKAIESELRRSEEQYRRLLDELPDSVSIYHENQILFINQAAIELFGYSWGEVKTMPVMDFIHPDDRRMFTDRQKQLKLGEVPVAEEVRYVRRDGSIVVGEVHSRSVDFEGFDAGMSIIRDLTKQRANEKALRRSEEQYRRLLNEIPESVVISREDSILYMNASGLDFFGYQWDEVKAMSKLDFICPEDHQISRQRQVQFDADGLFPVVEGRFLKKDGSVTVVEVHSLPTIYEGQEARLSIIRDLTERQASEKALRQSEIDFRNLIEQLPEPILIHQNGLIKFANQATLDLFGYESVDEAIGAGISKYIHHADLDIFLNLIDSQDTHFTLEARGVRSDGRIIFIEAKIYKTSFGGTGVDILIMRDSTLRRKLDQEAEEFREELERQVMARTRELQASEKRLTGILNSSQDAIVSVDENQQIVSFNKGAETVFQFKETEVMGQSLDVLIPDDVVLSHRVMVEEFVDKNLNYLNMRNRSEILGKRKNGELFPVEASISKVEVFEKQILTVFLRDVTERKIVEEELQRSESQLRQAQKMEAVGQLAGGIAHDFNNLLTAINGYSEWLLEGLDPKDPMYQDLSEIKKAGDRAAALTRQLLAFGRKQVLRPQVIDLNEIVLGMTNMLRRLIGEHIELNVQYGPDLQKVNADPGQIEQVIMNLAINARDAMPDGGKINVNIGNVTLDQMKSFKNDDLPTGDCVMLLVSDTGFGMEQEVLAHIFEPFYTTKGVDKGTGLGLSTVFGIVKQSGGGIRVESEPGKGSVFQVYLPVAENPESVAETETQRPLFFEGKETILVVEDEEVVRELLKRKLQSFGYTILTADHGKEALLIIEHYEGPIDLVITDVIMPKMGGHELVRRLSEAHPELPVLYISGYDEEMVIDGDLVDMGRQFIQKPFHTREVAEKIRKTLDEAIPRH